MAPIRADESLAIILYIIIGMYIMIVSNGFMLNCLMRELENLDILVESYSMVI
jgi:hypothetical protein